jgi:hypothetical protein
MERVHDELTCPLSLELLLDPIVVPCCQRAVSRSQLVLAFQRRRHCPMCNGDLSNYDAATAPKNLALEKLVEAVQVPAAAAAPVRPEHRWSAWLDRVEQSQMAELTLQLEDSLFATCPSLFIAVVDRSGSMAGNAWRQVQQALVHIIGLTNSNPLVRTVIVAYESSAVVVPTEVDAVRALAAGGGTNFSAAYLCVKDVLSRFAYSEKQSGPTSVSSVQIAFLTDGQADGVGAAGTRDALIAQFQVILKNSGWPEEAISVHAVGFGNGCDKDLLEGLRSAKGTFR